MLTIFHNPMCRKSRNCLDFIKERNFEHKVINYFREPFTEKELKSLLIRLNKTPFEIVRKQEAIFKSNFKKSQFNDDEWIKVLIEYPSLIMRPIVSNNYKAVIGDPSQNILELL
jgi:arsenate reductase (glutaredoxin)